MSQSLRLFKKQFLERRLSSLMPATPISLSTVSLSPGDTVEQAIRLLQANKNGSVLVCDADGKLCGIFTERDVVTRLSEDFDSFVGESIEKVMTPEPIRVKHFSSVSRALFLMSEHGFRHLPIEDPSGVPTGVLSSKDLVDYLHTHIAKRLLEGDDLGEDYCPNQVENFMGSSIACLKPSPVVIAAADASVRSVMKLMRENNVGCIPIGIGEKINGIFTERDYVLKVLLQGPEAEEQTIGNVMTADPHTLLLSNSVSMAFTSLSGGGFRHLPIVDGMEKLVGIVSVKDMLKAVLRGVIDELQSQHA